jgi:hypothetical protein
MAYITTPAFFSPTHHFKDGFGVQFGQSKSLPYPMIVTHPGLSIFFLCSIQLASLAPASLDRRLPNAPADDGQAENQDRAGTINPFV